MRSDLGFGLGVSLEILTDQENPGEFENQALPELYIGLVVI